MKDNKINIILGAKKILSVNAIYSAKLVYTPRGQVPQIYKSGEAKKVEAYIGEQIILLDVPNNFPWITKNTLFKMDIMVIFKSGFLLRDLDNTLKLIQDGIFRALDINDSHVVSINAHKKLFPGISEEKIMVCLTEVGKDDIRYDKIPHPHIIWSENNILNLKPVLKRGLKEDVKYWTTEQDAADTYLYYLGPNEFSQSNSVDIALKMQELMITGKGFGYIIIESENNYDTEDWKQMICFKSRIEEMSKVYSGIHIGSLEDIKQHVEGD